MNRSFRWSYVLILLFFLSGCSFSNEKITNSATPTIFQSSSSQVFQASNTPTQTTATSTPEPSPTKIESACSPLTGISRSELRLITSNPFIAPSPFVENINAHPAIDFSFYSYKDFKTFKGFPIQAVFPGKVALVINNRFPYGNSLIVETPLDQIDFQKYDPSIIPTVIPTTSYPYYDVCPVAGPEVTWSKEGYSLYTLYAHFQENPEFIAGQDISCGEPLGLAGKTGNSFEEHLHLEMRIGPSNAKFGTISSYYSTSTSEERYNYCIWSLSGHFQAIDPALILYESPLK